MLLTNLGVNDPPFAADSWINDRDVNRPGRKPRSRFSQHDRPGPDVARRNGVGNVNNSRPRIDRKNHALHRTDIPAAWTEIGSERDDRRRQMILSHGRFPLAKDEQTELIVDK